MPDMSVVFQVKEAKDDFDAKHAKLRQTNKADSGAVRDHLVITLKSVVELDKVIPGTVEALGATMSQLNATFKSMAQSMDPNEHVEEFEGLLVQLKNGVEKCVQHFLADGTEVASRGAPKTDEELLVDIRNRNQGDYLKEHLEVVAKEKEEEERRRKALQDKERELIRKSDMKRHNDLGSLSLNPVQAPVEPFAAAPAPAKQKIIAAKDDSKIGSDAYSEPAAGSSAKMDPEIYASLTKTKIVSTDEEDSSTVTSGSGSSKGSNVAPQNRPVAGAAGGKKGGHNFEDFEIKTLKTTKCKFCHDRILLGKVFRCSQCGLVCHVKCCTAQAASLVSCSAEREKYH